jgi:hypothetical protein
MNNMAGTVQRSQSLGKKPLTGKNRIARANVTQAIIASVCSRRLRRSQRRISLNLFAKDSMAGFRKAVLA